MAFGWPHLSGGVSFIGNFGEQIATPLPCGRCATTPVCLFCKGGVSDGLKLWSTNVFLDPLSLVIKYLRGGGHKLRDLVVLMIDK